MSPSFADQTLEVRDLVLERGERELFHGLAFKLDSGELLQLAGRNGSGKTSLLRVLCGLSRPLQGEVLWNGQSLSAQEDGPAAHLAYLAHLNASKEELNAEENIRLSSALQGRNIGREEAWEMLGQLDLRGFEDLPVKFLSQGQKRRVALAKLLLSARPLWIMDEPFAALDVQVIQVLKACMEDQLKRGGMIVLTTHQAVPIEGPQQTVTLGDAR
ncbi:heme exporter protein A [Ectothiorhodosinus mongolicus]|uniref:Heme exporter protein A n=1 Tax=Ectothiorhodosinus mongolicus TaxID=233100 RepID=A0A1R3VZ26_9GAMM|nr:cytochrome c biogenesis heme-transporting ATPase CcmA [Ectothiorhodosinus mongolicus]ULX57188.1 cytochrome c biogenesis heme-transporting ATPase CcmA [Ectothiorhodosinus mongolicus]SIT70323.1 heme exporter protein A [Ectothiorhodosinus mongolicus]